MGDAAVKRTFTTNLQLTVLKFATLVQINSGGATNYMFARGGGLPKDLTLSAIVDSAGF